MAATFLGSARLLQARSALALLGSAMQVRLCHAQRTGRARSLIRFLNPSGDVCFGEPLSRQKGKAQLVKDPNDASLELSPAVADVAELLAPVPCTPPAVWCVGLNYKKHAEEVQHDLPAFPVLTMKSATALLSPLKNIVIPSVASKTPEVDIEAELCIVIGRKGSNIRKEDAMKHILGFTVANDVSARRWQGKKMSGQWVRAKSFDTFLPVGPTLVTPEALEEAGLDIQNLQIRSFVNGEMLQNASTKDMIFSPADLVSFISQDTTLLPGTLILTGTPQGVGYARDPPIFLKPGDVVCVSIEHIGDLINPVVAAP